MALRASTRKVCDRTRDRLPVDWKVEGPAIIEDAWSTIIVDPGATAWVDEHTHLHITVEAGGK